MIRAQVEALGKGLHAEIFAKMLVDIAQDLLHLGVAACLCSLGRSLVQAIDMDEKLDDERLAHGLRAEARVCGGFLIGFDGGFQFLELFLCGGEQVPPSPVRLIKAVHEAGAWEGPFKIPAVQVEDDALIGAAAVNDSLVDGMVPHQQHRPGRQVITLLFYQIVDASFEQDHQLVKFVKVKIQLLPGRILEMKIVKTLAQIACTVDTVVRHGDLLAL